MARHTLGWERREAVPNPYPFNDFLSARDGHLYYEDIDLARLMLEGHPHTGQALSSPLEIIHLPKIRQKIDAMQHLFAAAIAELDYAGRFHYAYASKANAAEEVVRTALDAGTHYEMSSRVDVEIARLMKSGGHLRDDRFVLANGFKTSGSNYSNSLIQFKREHDNLLPVIEDVSELPALIDSGLAFDVGLRQKSNGLYRSVIEMDAVDSRFGLNLDGLWQASDMIAAAPNLRLKLYHAMIGSQLIDASSWIASLKPAIEIYARLRQRHPDLSIFDFGGGMPAPMTLDFTFDYHDFVRMLLITLQDTCAQYKVPVPDVLGEFGRYTTAEHGAHLFKVITVKDNGSELPWYIIDGSVMASFPDVWAIGEHFIVLPLNHLDQPFQRVRLGGVTCDSDDVYPQHKSESVLYLPVTTQGLYIGFFCVGAYQEMLGGARGSKHCVLPEAAELIIDRDADGRHRFEVLPGQTTEDVLRNLNYAI